jgi:hypothetical protein
MKRRCRDSEETVRRERAFCTVTTYSVRVLRRHAYAYWQQEFGQ